MWVFQPTTYTGQPTLHSHATKLGLRSTSSNAINENKLHVPSLKPASYFAWEHELIKFVIINCNNGEYLITYFIIFHRHLSHRHSSSAHTAWRMLNIPYVLASPSAVCLSKCSLCWLSVTSLPLHSAPVP